MHYTTEYGEHNRRKKCFHNVGMAIHCAYDGKQKMDISLGEVL